MPELIDRLLNVVAGDVAAAKRDLAAAREALAQDCSPLNERRYRAALMHLYLASEGRVNKGPVRVDENPERWDGLS